MRKHRKLFPTVTNGTACSDFCDDPFGEFYYPQPPPPPSPLTVADRNDGVSPSVVVLFTLLASFLLFLLYYVVVSKSCLGLFRSRRGSYDDDGEHLAEGSQSDGGEFVDHHQHPIWLISTVGLQQPIINSITVVRYRNGEGLIEGRDCSVCLSEFRENETLRLLPKCSHAFHVPCIDTWLRSHTNCPLCRAHIVAEANNPVAASAGGGSVDVSANQNAVVEGDRPVEQSDAVGSPLRRSVSMGSRDEKFLRMIRVSPIAMKKRSSSCGERFFSSRQNYN